MQDLKEFLALKLKVHHCCEQLVTVKLTSVSEDLILLQEDQQKDVKSSMGDKYETGPAMLNQQRQRLLNQQQQINGNLRALQQLNPQSVAKAVDIGSLVSTDKGLFYLSIGLGEVTCEEQSVWVISLQSPLGQQLKGSREQDSVSFQGRTYQIMQLA